MPFLLPYPSILQPITHFLNFIDNHCDNSIHSSTYEDVIVFVLPSCRLPASTTSMPGNIKKTSGKWI